MGRRGHRRAGPGAVTRRRVVAPVALELSAQDSDRLLTSAPRPHPRPLTPEGTRGAGRGRACAAREGGRGWGRGREARALSPGRQLRESEGFRAVPVWDPRTYVDFISRHRVTESGGRGNSQPRPSCD